jgi:hypothetical protein
MRRSRPARRAAPAVSAGCRRGRLGTAETCALPCLGAYSRASCHALCALAARLGRISGPADAYGPGEEKGAKAQGENERLIASLLDELGLRQVLLPTKGGHVRTAGGGLDADSSVIGSSSQAAALTWRVPTMLAAASQVSPTGDCESSLGGLNHGAKAPTSGGSRQERTAGSAHVGSHPSFIARAGG